MKNFATWLAYLKSIHPQEIEMGLARINTVAKRLAVTEFPIPVIMVAGTNGKGSCIAVLEKIYLAAGFAVASYTSPQLLHCTDQIRLQGQEVSEQQLCDAFALIEQAREAVSLSYFEFITLAALSIFKANNLDVILLEVGMGGRDDAVNIVNTDLAIVTSIDIDHIHFLGNTRDAIALHKAGIFRAGKFAVCGDATPPASLLQYAQDIGTKLVCLHKDFSYKENTTGWNWNFAQQSYHALPLPLIDLPIAATALTAINLLQTKLTVSESAIKQGLRAVNLAGRFQIIKIQPIIILDVAHNVAACKNLVNKIKKKYPGKKIRIVAAMLKDKDIENCLACFCDIAQAWYVASLAGERGASYSRLENYLRAISLQNIHSFELVTMALEQCLRVSKVDDIILVFGSFLTVAAVLESLS